MNRTFQRQRATGRRRKTELRDVVGSIFEGPIGAPISRAAKDFSLCPTVQRCFHGWLDKGVWQIINHLLRMDVREVDRHEANQPAGLIDGQSVKMTGSGGPARI